MRTLIFLFAFCFVVYAGDSCTGCQLPDHYSSPSFGEVIMNKKIVNNCELLHVTCEKVTQFSLSIRLEKDDFAENNNEGTIECKNGKWYATGNSNAVEAIGCHYVIH